MTKPNKNLFISSSYLIILFNIATGLIVSTVAPFIFKGCNKHEGFPT